MHRTDVKQRLPQLFVSGFVATFLMTLMLLPAFQIGLAKLDFANLIGFFLSGHEVEPRTMPWWIGMFEHFLNGTVLFPLVYALWVGKHLRGSPVLKGIVWGLILWVFAQTVAMPLLGIGIFSSKAPEMWVLLLGSLFGHTIYGVAFCTISDLSSSLAYDE